MPREDVSSGFEEYFWKGLNLDAKVILDAGTGFGQTTSEIARRISQQRRKGKITSVDIDPASFEEARRRLKAGGLQGYVTFVKADLSKMPQIDSESIDIIISTCTLADINSHPCRLVKAIAEFHRVLKPNSRIVLSDECPLLRTKNREEQVAVMRGQLAKAITHLIGTPHANEVEPKDLESTMELTGFKKCRWAIFQGDKITQQRINHFVIRASEKARLIHNKKLANAFLEEIQYAKSLFDKQAGILPPRYIFHAQK